MPERETCIAISPAFQPVKDLLEQGIQDGLHPGAQLCVALDGEVVADFAVGESVVATGTAITPDSVMPLFSSAKPITAVAIGVLADSGRLNFNDLVATHIPEFAARGRSNIQIKHLLNHTSGLAYDALADGGQSRAAVIVRLSDSHTIEGFIPGECSKYNPTAGWHILGEVIERASGTSFEAFIQDFILDPLGMSETYPNVPPRPGRRTGISKGADAQFTTSSYDRASVLHTRAFGPICTTRQQFSWPGPRHGEVLFDAA